MINVYFQNNTYNDTTPYEKLIIDVFYKTFDHLGLKNDQIEVSVIFVDNDEIRQINKEYRNIDKVTDVISFALEDEVEGELEIIGDFLPRTLGDIFISIPRAIEQAKDYNHSDEREIGFLAVHGLLHLLGYDHQSSQEEKEMISIQELILSEMGLKRE